MLEEKTEKLNERAERIPAVIGKVKGSMNTFPYIRNAYECFDVRAETGRCDLSADDN